MKNASYHSILISAFDPFGGEASNNSLLVAEELKSLLYHKQKIVDLCILPVVYDIAAEILIQKIDACQRTPELVLSLGEAKFKNGEDTCPIYRIETQAQNLDNTKETADNAGNFRTQVPIINGLPEFVSLPSDLLSGFLNDKDAANFISYSAGNFVCNNTAFRMAHFCNSKHIDYAFIHVPADKSLPSHFLKEIARTIAVQSCLK